MSSESYIKALCARAIMAEEGPEAECALRELHAALKAHIESLREMAAVALLSGPQQAPRDSPQA